MTTLNDRQIIKKLTLRHVVLQAPRAEKRFWSFPPPLMPGFFTTFFWLKTFLKTVTFN